MMMITEVSRSEHSELCTTAVAGTPGWESRAACSDATGEVTKLFFSDELPDIALAKRLCAGCPVLLDCLEAAVARNEQFGVWGTCPRCRSPSTSGSGSAPEPFRAASPQVGATSNRAPPPV